MTRKRKNKEARSRQPCSFFKRRLLCKAGDLCLFAHTEHTKEPKDITPDIPAQVENLARVIPAEAREYFKTHCKQILLEAYADEIQREKYIAEVTVTCCNWFRIAFGRNC
jgi:hypothetical protein